MRRLSAATHISMGLACMTLSVLLGAQFLGLFPDDEKVRLESRRSLCEALAVSCSLSASTDDTAAMKAMLEAAVQRNDDVLSAGVRRTDGELLVQAGGHEKHWDSTELQASTPTHAQVPIYRDGEPWAAVEVRFTPLASAGAGWLRSSVAILVAVACFCFFCFLLYLRRTLQHLDPSKVIPARVQAMLDALAEGVLVLDAHERIVLANERIARSLGSTSGDLQGMRASELPWRWGEEDAGRRYPWLDAIHDGLTHKGVRLGLQIPQERATTFMVNSAPILGTDRRMRGVLATFDDVTHVEETNRQLQKMLHMLRASRDEVDRQNQELQVLARQDPLTGCMNRRAFFEELERRWDEARRYQYPLSVVMLDIDHFKQVNDSHGHRTGDQVLQRVAHVLRETGRGSDLICRYGGEEFCILLPHTTQESAVLAGERFRAAVADRDCAGLRVTLSAGVSSSECEPANLQAMIDQADRALYVAKHGGRNRVCRWDHLTDGEQLTPGASGMRFENKTATGESIPLHAVHALTNAMAIRDTATAEHCRSVADLSVALCQDLLAPSDCFLMEIAGLLHDIGKLGVPDRILLKPGELTSEEWEVMHSHNRMGWEIIESSFNSPELTEIVQLHHVWYDGSNADPGQPSGADLPLRSRILAIADAYDAMISPRPYRGRMSSQEAFVELRRCAGTQFDPDLVARFVEKVLDRDATRSGGSGVPSRQTMLEAGRYIDQLTSAIDAQQWPTVSDLALRVRAVAVRSGLGDLALAVDELRQAVEQGEPVLMIEHATHLVDLYRAHQSETISAQA